MFFISHCVNVVDVSIVHTLLNGKINCCNVEVEGISHLVWNRLEKDQLDTIDLNNVPC